MKTFIIAEAGANHNRDIKITRTLIEIAAEAGADAVKFQTYSSETLYSKYTPDFGVYKNIPKLIKDIELPREWQKDLKSICDDNGIEFMSTPFDERAIEELVSLGVKRMKISSFEALDPRFVKLVASANKQVIFSSGVSSNTQLAKQTFDIISKVQNKMHDTCILHCNSAYPTPISDVNLQQIDELKQITQNVGFSDHTMSTVIPAYAVIKGVKVIEKHFTLNRGFDGPDHGFALEPVELVEMISNIRNAEQAIGSKRISTTVSENSQKTLHALRSIFAKKKIRAGEIIDESNITTKRPYFEGNISASLFYDIIGKYVATTDIDEDFPVTYIDIINKI